MTQPFSSSISLSEKRNICHCIGICWIRRFTGSRGREFELIFCLRFKSRPYSHVWRFMVERLCGRNIGIAEFVLTRFGNVKLYNTT